MMLTAGLGVSEMTIGWDNMALELGGVTPLLLSNDAVDIPLDRGKTKKFKCEFSNNKNLSSKVLCCARSILFKSTGQEQ